MTIKRKEKKGRAITYLELHGADFVQDLSHVLPDHGPGDFVVTLRRGLHGVPRHVVKCNHVWEDANSFVEGAEPVWGGQDAWSLWYKGVKEKYLQPSPFMCTNNYFFYYFQRIVIRLNILVVYLLDSSTPSASHCYILWKFAALLKRGLKLKRLLILLYSKGSIYFYLNMIHYVNGRLLLALSEQIRWNIVIANSFFLTCHRGCNRSAAGSHP